MIRIMSESEQTMPYPDEILLDFERMRELKEIISDNPSDELPEEINDLYVTYLRSVEKNLLDAETTLRVGDTNNGGRHVHSIKGASANAGAPKVRELALQLEQMLKKNEGTTEEHLARLKEIRAVCEETFQAIIRCYKIQI